MRTLMDTLYTAWIIGTKDILDALKNKSSRSNIIIIVALVVFFYYFSTLRPFDKNIGVVFYDEGNTSLVLESASLGNGAKYSFQKASSLSEMERMMAYQELGLVIPADFDQILASDGIPTLSGYIYWVNRMKVVELETKYSQAFTEIIGRPVQVVIGKNIIIPQANADGDHTSVTFLMVYFVFTTALLLIPHLMLEEKRTKTLDALLTSPASHGQVVFGKAIAGFFYILIIGGLGMALFSAYIVNWIMALAAFLAYALFAVGLGLVVGSFINSTKQIGLWMAVLLLFLAIPPLFYMESNLKDGIRIILTWFPSSALASILRYSCSIGVTPAQFIPNLAIALVSIAAAFGLVIWKVRRFDH